VYELFFMAYRWQGLWSEQQHIDFWRASLPLWPRKTGQRQMTDQLTQWVLRLRAAGASDRELDSLMGYCPGSLRRMGVLWRADSISAWWDSVVVDDPEEIRRLTRARHAKPGLHKRTLKQRSLPVIHEQGAPRWPAGALPAWRMLDFVEAALSPADRAASEHVERMARRALEAIRERHPGGVKSAQMRTRTADD